MEYITTKEAKKGGAGKGLQSVAADSSLLGWHAILLSSHVFMLLSHVPLSGVFSTFFVFQIIVHFSFFHLNKIYQISYVPVASQNRCVKI